MSNPNDIQRICDGLAKLEGSVPGYTGSKKKAARSAARFTFRFGKGGADAMASTTTAHTASSGVRAPFDGIVLGAYYTSKSTLTADANNNAVLNVNKSDGAGGAATAMASGTTNVAFGNMVAGGIKTLTPDATIANRRFTKGQLLSPSVAKNGTGVVVPDGEFQIDVEAEGPYDYEVV